MKWILLTCLIFYCGPNDSTSSGNNIERPLSLATNARQARTLGFSSEEDDENGIHLHIWNDMTNKNNFYPNLMQHIAEESVKSSGSSASSALTESNPGIHLSVNLNELMPTPQPQVSAVNLLKNALVHSLELDKFRKSDQSLYGSFYQLKTEQHEQPTWNYHPTSVNYIPKPAQLRNGVSPTTASTESPKMTLATKITTTSRPTLREQMRTTRHFGQDYYTNLPKSKPKSIIQSIGYEIGGLSKYSGRLLANEPTPQQHRTFKMFEPVPRQIMLPPPAYRLSGIPDFKPVPPRLKLIPVIDDIIGNRNQLTVGDGSKLSPWNLVKIEQKVKPSSFSPVPPKQLQIIPFKTNEAITMTPFRHYVPKTEYNQAEPSTKANHHSVYSPDIETLQKLRATQNQMASSAKAWQTATTKMPRLTEHFSDQYDDASPSNQSTSVFRRFPNDDYITDSKSPMFFNGHTQQHSFDYEYKAINKNNVGIASLTKPVSSENAHSNFTARRQTKNEQHTNDTNVNLTPAKGINKKTKTARRKPQQPSIVDERSVNSNKTSFHERNDNGSTENDTTKLQYNARNGNSGVYALELGAYRKDRMPSDVIIDSVPSDSIQLSQTYSRQTTNVPQHKPTSSPLPSQSMPTTTKTTATTIRNERDEQTLQQLLANDIRKALLTSLNNDTHDHDASAPHDPFLIAVYDENDRAIHDVSDDLQFAETAEKAGDGRKWATDRRDVVARSSNENSDENFQDKPKTKLHQMKLNNIDNMHRTDQSDQTQFKFPVNNDSSSDPSGNSIDEKYYKWFNEYAEENKKFGRTIISEHFKKVEIQPNIKWATLPRRPAKNNGTDQIHRNNE